MRSAPEGAHALRIGRASALLVTPAPLGVADGWREGWCVTAVDDGWAAIDVSGADAPQALAQGTSADLAANSPSAAVVFFGLRVPVGEDGRGIPGARRGVVARDAYDLVGRSLMAGSTSALRIVISPPSLRGAPEINVAPCRQPLDDAVPTANPCERAVVSGAQALPSSTLRQWEPAAPLLVYMWFELLGHGSGKWGTALVKWTHGPAFEDGGIRFRLWAAGEKQVGLVIDGQSDQIAMTPAPNGFFETFVKDLRAGARYRFALPDGQRVPDPASRFQPEDVNGPSEAIDSSAYDWRESWQGRQWDDIVLYELHVGAFLK